MNKRNAKPTKPACNVRRRSYRELFVDKLRELSDGELGLIPNATLREALDWNEDRYKRIKAQLVDDNTIIVGRGQGGRIGLVDAHGGAKLKVFVSYSHADSGLKDELLKHLTPLHQMNLIEEWNDRQLKGGDEWDRTISQNLNTADIILLLVSIDFINSKYCYDIELDKALELHDQKKAVVIPIILRNCMWKHTPFAKIQALPKEAKAVNSWDDRDEALASIAESIRVVADDILTSR